MQDHYSGKILVGPHDLYSYHEIESNLGTSLFLAVKDPTFMSSALAYVEETLLNAEIVKLLPKFLAPPVGGLLSRCLSSHKKFFKSLIPATEQRIQELDRKHLGHSGPQRVSAPESCIHSIVKTSTKSLLISHQADCIQWILETAPKQSPWSAERVIYELMAIWFGSVHILSTVRLSSVYT